MKVSKRQLRKLIREQVEIVVTEDTGSLLRDTLVPYLASLRALHLWFHSAHNLTKGTGFAGDHTELYGNIYVDLQDHFDAAVEKAIGLTQDESVGCPILLVGKAFELIKQYASPSGATAHDIAQTALNMLQGHSDLLADVFYSLEGVNALPLGLNDFLMSSANTYETYTYLLQQRLKEGQ